MSASGALNVIDDYLEALLDDTATGAIALHDGAGAAVIESAAMATLLASSPPEPSPVPSPPMATAAAALPATHPEADLMEAVMAKPIAMESQPSAASASPPLSPAPAAHALAATHWARAEAASTPSPAAPMHHAVPAHATGTIVQGQRWLRAIVGQDSYALELLCVQEVVRMAPIVAMRGAARAVLGVMNLRGRIVPVFDLGLWLDTPGVQPDERNRIVVIERNDELIGVLVSAVEDVVTLGRDRIEPPLPGSDPGAMVGIARVGATPTVLLDANALFG